MKIIFLEAVQTFGGARKSTIELATRLKAVGHEVMIVDFWGSCTEFIRELNDRSLLYEILDTRDDPIIISGKSKIESLSNRVKYLFKQELYRKRFSKIVYSFNPDIVSVNNLKCLNILNYKPSYKIYYFARGWFAYNSISNYAKKRLKKYKPDFLTVSQSTRQAIFTGGIAPMEKIKVLNSVIESKLFESYRPSFEFFQKDRPIRILHSGGFLKTKGQITCIEVAKILQERSIPFEMYFTGIIYKGAKSINYYNEVIDMIEWNNLNKEIKIIINPPNIMDYFKKTDILIHPSWTEGLPRVCLEALAFGKPIIANPAGGVTDVVIHNLTGFITDFNNINQYADYIEKYYRDTDLYKSHSLSGRKLIEQNYLDENQIESIRRIFKD